MDLFGEKKYEDLDLLTKMIEPVTWSLLDTIADLPKEVSIPEEYIVSAVAAWQEVQFNDALETFVVTSKYKGLGSRERDYLRGLYKFEFSKDITVNLETSSMIGYVKLVREKDTIEEKDLLSELKRAGFGNGYMYVDHNDPAQLERMREILDLMGTTRSTEALKKRTGKQLERGIIEAYRQVMKDNSWNIRSIDLANKVTKWIEAYIKTGNLAAMRNFCLLKAATHRGYPIYQIDEELL